MPKALNYFLQKALCRDETQPRCARHEAQRSDVRFASVRMMKAVTQPHLLQLAGIRTSSPSPFSRSSCALGAATLPARVVHAAAQGLQTLPRGDTTILLELSF